MVTEAERTARNAVLQERVVRIGRQVFNNEPVEPGHLDADRIGARLHPDDPHTADAYAPILALAVPATLVASDTAERPYLYLDHAMSWSQYALLLGACVSVGLITAAEFERCFAARNTIVPAPGTYATAESDDHISADDLELVRQLTVQLQHATDRIQALTIIEQQFAALEDTIETLRQQTQFYRNRYQDLSERLNETRTRLEAYEASASATLSW